MWVKINLVYGICLHLHKCRCIIFPLKLVNCELIRCYLNVNNDFCEKIKDFDFMYKLTTLRDINFVQLIYFQYELEIND